MNPANDVLSHELIDEASNWLRGRVRETPVELSTELSDRLGRPVYLKLENLQETGSFKVRGALFALHRAGLAGADHVATCSAGNHGKGLAWAAARLGMRAVVYVPASVDASKLGAIRESGAEVHVGTSRGFDDTERWARAEATASGAVYVSAYDDLNVMAANGGSVADEVFRQVPSASTFVMPAGGGGFSSGFVFRMSGHLVSPWHVLCQHEGCPALRLSLERGEVVTEMPAIETLASGLEGGFGRQPFDVLSGRVDQVCEASEDALKGAMQWMYRAHGYRIEGSSAVALAALLAETEIGGSGDVVLFVSGGNVDEEVFRGVLASV